MNEYEITIYYTMHGSSTITVEAEDEDEAFDTAYDDISDDDIDWNYPEQTDSDIECTRYEEDEEVEYDASRSTPPWQRTHDKQPSIED